MSDETIGAGERESQYVAIATKRGERIILTGRFPNPDRASYHHKMTGGKIVTVKETLEWKEIEPQDA